MMGEAGGQERVVGGNRWLRWLTTLAMVGSLLATLPVTVYGTPSRVEAQALFDDELFDQDYVMHTANDKHEEALQVAEKVVAAEPGNQGWRRRAARSAELAGRRRQALNHWLYLAEQGDGVARQSALRLTRSMH
jgi:hypothetical protein